MIRRVEEDQGYADRLNRWLRQEIGAEESRRIVSRTDARVLISKFEAGLAERLRESLDRRADLFDLDAVSAAYARRAALSPDMAMVEVWRLAMGGMLADGHGPNTLTPAQQSEVMAGVDSVAAVLASALWSEPTAGEEYQPQDSERRAYRDALARLDRTDGLFTRRYGVFEGARVVNHCPGAPYARRLLALGWRVCTGTEPPSPDDDERLPASK